MLMFKTSKLTIVLGLVVLALAYVAAKEVTNHSIKDNVLEPRATFVDSVAKPGTKSGGSSGGNGGKNGGGNNNNSGNPPQDLSVRDGVRLTEQVIQIPRDGGASGELVTVRVYYNTRQVASLADNEALIWRAAVYNEMHQSTRLQNPPQGMIGYTHHYRNNELYAICAVRKISDTEYHVQVCGYGDVKNGVHRFK